MKEKYKKLDKKTAFLKSVAIRLGVELATLKGYFTENGTIPAKHKERIEKAIELQLLADEKIRQIEVDVFEKI